MGIETTIDTTATVGKVLVRQEIIKRLPPLMRVCLCCNDPRNGMPTGWIDHVHIVGRGGMCELSGPMPHGIRGYTVLPNYQVRIGRLRYVYIQGPQNWVGNWCIDAFIMPAGQVVRLMNYLLFHAKGWDMQAGPCGLFEKWNLKQRLEYADVAGALGKPSVATPG